MSVKKILSIIMALAMVLTMASFPAFAEDAAKLTYDSYTSDVSAAWTTSPLSNLFDTSADSVYTPSKSINSTELGKGELNIYLDIAGDAKYNISKVEFTGRYSQYFSGFAVYGSNESATAEAEWTLLGNCTGKEGGAKVTIAYDVTHEGGYKYLRFEGYDISKKTSAGEVSHLDAFQLQISTLAFYGTEYVDESATTVGYTVNYVDAEGKLVAESKSGEGLVGDGVTESAISIPNYKLVSDAATETIVLEPDSAENVIKFVYEYAEDVTYTVKYVDETGAIVEETKTVESYDGETVTETAPDLFAKGYVIVETTQSITLDAEAVNEIEFVYTKVIVPQSATFTGLNDTTGYATSGTYNFKNVINGKLTNGGTYSINSNGTASPYAEMIFTFDKVYAFDTMTAFWSNGDTTLAIYVSNDGETWGDPVFEGKADTTTVGSIKASEIALEGNAGKYIKVETTKKQFVTMYEITFEGSEVAVPEFADNVVVEGAQIRLPESGIYPGIRFAATLKPSILGVDVNEFAFDPTGDIKFGMFIIPVDILGGMTFADYLVANEYKGQALDVVAENIYGRDEEKGVTYTAVLRNIPEGEYDRAITAIPYACVNGEYHLAANAAVERTYRGVAEAINADYEAGKITLNDTQHEILTGIIG